jgi:4-amino-4-deoxy-L-arabinose transferase-like glycosyltransferase
MRKTPAPKRTTKPIRVRPAAGSAGGPVPWAWLPAVVLLAGAALRIAYAAGSDVRNVYDDHFEVTRIILEQHRWPHPDENWEAYQPPLYHTLSALTYWLVSGHSHVPPAVKPTPAEQQSGPGIACPYAWHVAGRKAIQFLSAAAGIGTLVLVWLTLRWLFPGKVLLQTVSVVLAAFLPRLIYMSGMATNDALLWLWSSICVYATLRGRGGKYYWWVVAGIGAALALWTKHNGLGCLAVLVAALLASIPVRDGLARRRLWRGALLAMGMAMVLGAWPYVRTYRLTGTPIASPFTRMRNAMVNQLPGRLSDVSWLSFRPLRLLAQPWVHVSTVDSFWTALYAELWFDYGTSATAYQYRPWRQALGANLRSPHPTGRELERAALARKADVTPPSLLWEGRLLIALGLIPTVVVLLGVGAIWRRTPDGAAFVLMTMAILGVATPAFQTIRQPFRSSMKATFALWAIVPVIVLFATGYTWLGERRGGAVWQWVVGLDVALLATVAAWHFVDLAYIFPRCADYYARRDPL